MWRERESKMRNREEIECMLNAAETIDELAVSNCKWTEDVYMMGVLHALHWVLSGEAPFFEEREQKVLQEVPIGTFSWRM